MTQTKPATFAEFLVELMKDEPAFRAFSEGTKSPQDLQAFVEANGYTMSKEESERVFESAQALLNAAHGQQIPEQALEGVNGGLPAWAIGAISGGALGALAFGGACALAMVSGPLAPTVIAALAALSSGGVGAFAGGTAVAGAVSAVAGGVAGQLIHEA